jgi:hypothetical protein
LEVVRDLTTDAFLAAYKRFTARRGHCVQMYNDYGTNFVFFAGAANKLDKDLKLAIQEATEEIAKLIEDNETTWKFIPPATPHFGGI